MNYDELLELLDIDEPSQFQYFENISELIETEEEYEFEDFALLIKNVDNKVLAELLDEYFTEILNGVPDSATEFYTLLQTIGMSLIGMANGVEEEEDVALLCDEIYRFRNWFTFDTCVNVRPENSGEQFKRVTPLEALISSRAEQFESEGALEYDFEPALNYELKDYVMSFRDVASAQDYDDMPNENGLEDGYLFEDELEKLE